MYVLGTGVGVKSNSMPYANNQGIRIHYEVEGEGPPLVLIHGFTGSLEDWRDFGYVDGLKDDYRLILMDERGHGASDKPHDSAAYEMKRRVSDVTAVLNDLNIGEAHVLGYSMGGEVCFGMAKYAPERAPSLVIGGMHPYTPRYPEIYNQQIQILTEGIEAAADAWGPKSPERKRRFLRNDVKALISSTIVARDWSGCADILLSMTMPCLLYAGEADRFMYSSIRECVNHIPNAVFVSLPNLDHGQAYRQSNQVLPHITRFFAQICKI